MPATRHRRTTTIYLLVGVVVLLLAAMCSLKFGVRSTPTAEVWHALLGDTHSTEAAAVTKRIPRTILAVIIGAALSIAGVSMQAVTRNPLADPGIFGVLAGASLAVVVGISFFGLSRAIPTMLVAIVGSGVAAVFVYAVGSLGRGGASPLKLALAGAATTAALSSAVSAVLLPRIQVMDSFRFWQIGGVGGADWERMQLAAPLLACGFALCFAAAPGLNALALGDDVATSLGENINRTRLVAAAGAVVLSGMATALAGPIAFVGLVVPHLTRLIVGTDHRWLLPASALFGAILLVSADTLGRVVTRPQEIAVGIIMPLLGVPLFLWIIRRYTPKEL